MTPPEVTGAKIDGMIERKPDIWLGELEKRCLKVSLEIVEILNHLGRPEKLREVTFRLPFLLGSGSGLTSRR